MREFEPHAGGPKVSRHPAIADESDLAYGKRSLEATSFIANDREYNSTVRVRELF
jgi:hypothetical protein